MGEDKMKRAAGMAAQWWADRFEIDDRRETFRAALEPLVLEALRERRRLYLECDYDPRGPLLEAVRAAGVECRGTMFSARGILPQKHELFVSPEVLKPKEGYGNWTDEIEVSQP